jgi:hypothetical protein
MNVHVSIHKICINFIQNYNITIIYTNLIKILKFKFEAFLSTLDASLKVLLMSVHKP